MVWKNHNPSPTIAVEMIKAGIANTSIGTISFIIERASRLIAASNTKTGKNKNRTKSGLNWKSSMKLNSLCWLESNTHVGSLPRSKELSELLFAKDKKENIDQSLFNDTVKKNVDEVVKRQLDVGIDVVSDGEMSKISYATYVKDRIKGFSGESERRAPADLDAFPEYKTKIANSGGTPTYTRPCCTSELEIQDTQSLKNDIKNLSDSLKSNSHSKAFMNAASPGVINVFMPNKFYKDDDTYLEKLSEVMSVEYKLITDSNIHLQLDCPDLALAKVGGLVGLI